MSNPIIPGLAAEHSDRSDDHGSLIFDSNSTKSKNSRFEQMRSSLRNTLFQSEKPRSLSVAPTSCNTLNNDDRETACTPTSDIPHSHGDFGSLQLDKFERKNTLKRSSMYTAPGPKYISSLDKLGETGDETHTSAGRFGNTSLHLSPPGRESVIDEHHGPSGFGSFVLRDCPGSCKKVIEDKHEDSLSFDDGTFEYKSARSNTSPRHEEKKISGYFQRDIEKEILEIKKDLGIEHDPHIHFIKGNFYDEYIEKEILGEGTSGTVKRIIKKTNDQALAVKVVHYRDDLEMIYLIVKEFKNQQRLNHKNIIKVYDLYIDYFKKKIYTVMELAECREMFEVLKDLGHYSEAVASGIFKQILASISYLHSNGVCHRDLKPNNILVSEEGNMIKITDFNVSKFTDKKKEKYSYFSAQNHKMWTYTGTIAFTAPEVFTDSEYTEAVDMWSAGVVLYTMLCGYQPFQGEYVSDLIEMIKTGKYEFPSDPWNNISKSAKHLIKHLLDVNPKTRYSPAQALMHPWIANKGTASNIIIPLAQSNLRSNYKRKFGRTNTVNVPAPMNKSGKKCSRKIEREHLKESRLINTKSTPYNTIHPPEDPHAQPTINSLQPKRGKTGPENFQSTFNTAFPIKLERSFSLSAYEDESDMEEYDEEDDEKELEGIVTDYKRSVSNILSPTLYQEEILKGLTPTNKQKESDKELEENIDSIKLKNYKIKLNGVDLTKKDEENNWLENRFEVESSKAQE